MREVLIVLMLLGCGGDDGGGTKPADAAIDMSLIDAPDFPATHHHYVIDKVFVPTTSTTALQYGFDLNGDMTVDNRLAMVLGTYASMGLDTQANMDKLVDTGGTILLSDLGTDDLTTESTATFTIYQGA